MSDQATRGDVKKKVGFGALKTPVHDNCQVCGQPGHGIHFGVLSCRACAAFFRRTVVMHRQYSCKRGTNSCKISKDERCLCRLCRYNKCLELGMTPDNVQWDRDILSTTLKGTKSRKIDLSENDVYHDDYEPQGLARITSNDCSSFSKTHAHANSAAKNMEGITTNLPDGVSSHESADNSEKSLSVNEILRPKIWYDITPIMNKLRRILTEFRPDGFLPNEPLERMRLALVRYRRFQLKEPQLKVKESVSFTELWTFWESALYATAEWLMHCKEFALLPVDEKMLLFKDSCIIWQRFERIAMSNELFGWRAVTEKLVALSFEMAVVINEVNWEMSCLTDRDPSYFKSMLQPFIGRLSEEVAKACLEIELTAVEVVYILCTLIWHVEGKNVSPETLLIAETYRDSISDDLHKYYTETLKTANYAARLIKIMSIIHCIEDIHHERSKVLELARIFDVWKIELSVKGMFDW